MNMLDQSDHMNAYWDVQRWILEHFRPRAIRKRKNKDNFYFVLFDVETDALKMYVLGYFMSNDIECEDNLDEKLMKIYSKLYRKIFPNTDARTEFYHHELDDRWIDINEYHMEAQEQITKFLKKYSTSAVMDWILMELLMTNVTQDFTKPQSSYRIVSALKSEAVMNMVYTIYKSWDPKLVIHQHGNYKYVKATVMEPEMKDKFLHDAIKYTKSGKSELRYRFNTLVTYFFTSELYLNIPIESLLYTKDFNTNVLMDINETITLTNRLHNTNHSVIMGMSFLGKLIQIDNTLLTSIYNYYKINDVPEQKESVCE
jgi:hypothetical protein